jgi:hypothetical protein
MMPVESVPDHPLICVSDGCVVGILEMPRIVSASASSQGVNGMTVLPGACYGSGLGRLAGSPGESLTRWLEDR